MTVSKKSFQDSSSYIIFELWFLPWFHIERRGVKEFLLILLFIYLITFSFVLEGDGLGSIESGFGAKFCSFVTSSFSCTFGLGMGTKLFTSHWINASYEVGLAPKIPVSRVNYFERITSYSSFKSELRFGDNSFFVAYFLKRYNTTPSIWSSIFSNDFSVFLLSTIPPKYSQDALQKSYYMYCPPLISKLAPVIKPLCSSAKKATMRAISCGIPNRPTGILAIIASKTSSFMEASISVLM